MKPLALRHIEEEGCAGQASRPSWRAHHHDNGEALSKRRDQPSGGDFAEGEETLPRDEHIGSSAEAEETRPRDLFGAQHPTAVWQADHKAAPAACRLARWTARPASAG